MIDNKEVCAEKKPSQEPNQEQNQKQEPKQKRLTDEELVTIGIESLNLVYDSKFGWTVKDSNKFEPLSITAARIRMELQRKNFKTVPCTSTIQEVLSVLATNARDYEEAIIYEALKFDPEIKHDYVDEIMRLITGNNYEPIVTVIMRQFVFQVKNKILGRVIPNPIFPIFSGEQGIGKTQFVRAFSRVLPPDKFCMMKNGDKVINSEAHVQTLADKLVIYLDEMGGMADSDKSILKSLIDCDEITFRPLYANKTTTVKVKASFISSTNDEVKTIIFNTHAQRKYCQIDFYSIPQDCTDRTGFVNDVVEKILSFDYLSLWKSVDENGVEPMKYHYNEFLEFNKKIQSTSETTAFLKQFIEEQSENYHRSQKTSSVKIGKKELIGLYRQAMKEERKTPMGEDKFYPECKAMGFIATDKNGNPVRITGGKHGFIVPILPKEDEETLNIERMAHAA